MLLSQKYLAVYIPILVDCTFQSEEGIARELGSLETCLTISTIREASPQVFFPPLNKSVDEESLSHTAHPPNTDTNIDTAAEQSEVAGTAKTETSLPEHTDEASTQNAERVEVLAPSHSIETATTAYTYDDCVARLLDVLQSAVHCRVSRAPTVAQREVVTQTPLHMTPALESGAVEEVDVQNMSGRENKLCCAQKIDSTPCGTVMRGSARVAILYSGGVDSAVLAALADRLVGMYI